MVLVDFKALVEVAIPVEVEFGRQSSVPHLKAPPEHRAPCYLKDVIVDLDHDGAVTSGVTGRFTLGLQCCDLAGVISGEKFQG